MNKKHLLILTPLLMLTSTLLGCNGGSNTKEYTVTFEYNCTIDGATKKEVKVKENECVSSIKLTRDKYTFIGWYYDNNTFKDPYNFNLPVIKNFSLYASWKENEKTPTEKFKERLKKNESSKVNHSTISGQYKENGGEKVAFNDVEIKENFAQISIENSIRVKYDTKSFEELCPVEDKDAIYLERDDYFQLGFVTIIGDNDAFIVLNLDNDNYLKVFDITISEGTKKIELKVLNISYK